MKKKLTIVYIITLLILIKNYNIFSSPYKEYDFIFPVIKFGGGGDWYGCLKGVKNFLNNMSDRIHFLNIKLEPKILSITDDDFFLYPFIFINGHGNIRFTEEEVLRLRKYLSNGGFLFANDDYGLDKSFRREIKRVFPDKKLVEVPFSHPIYHIYYEFPHGLPKIHEHYSGAPKGYGIFINNRLVLFYAFNSDIGDGWEKEEVFHDPLKKRVAALKMGINIILYAMSH